MKTLEPIIETGLEENKFYLDSRFHRIDVSFMANDILKRENVFTPIDYSSNAPDSADAFLIKEVKKSGESLFYLIEYYKINKRLE